MSEMITVFAASGRQGSATVSALLASGCPVRAVVRDPRKAAALRLADKGADVVPGSFDDKDAVGRALHGATGLYLYQPGFVSSQATPGTGPNDELRRGRAIIDAAVRAGVGHIVYSSALSADRPDTSPLLHPKPNSSSTYVAPKYPPQSCARSGSWKITSVPSADCAPTVCSSLQPLRTWSSSSLRWPTSGRSPRARSQIPRAGWVVRWKSQVTN